MLFSEALELMKEGHSMCRESWKIEDGYLKIMDGMKFVWKIVLLPNPNAGNYIFAIDDFYATDWKKFIMPVEVIEGQIAEAA
jgi:hypothetical protein